MKQSEFLCVSNVYVFVLCNQTNRKSHRVQKRSRSCILLGKQVNLRNILYSIAVSHNNCKVIMGAFGSKKGLKSCLIGDETLAKESLPTVSDSRWLSVGIILAGL